MDCGLTRLSPPEKDPESSNERIMKKTADDSSGKIESLYQRLDRILLHLLTVELGYCAFLIIGVLHFRNGLNAKLRRHGGHIGYGIRPSERGKGYAAWMPGMFPARLRVGKLGRVLNTCDDDNIPTCRTIERCGGRLRDTVRAEGRLTRRYRVAAGKCRGRQ